MAKQFYTLEEVCDLLGRDADTVKKMVRDGALREFRDQGKVYFKAEDVNKARGGAGARGSGDTGEIKLEPVEEELPSLSESGSGGTSIIGLEALGEPRGRNKQKEDTTVVPATGVGVFEDDEVEIDADPMAKTQITTGASDAVSLEGTGSGSGLLDLTREADDTSLGAELLDEIYPGEEEQAEAAPRAAVAPMPREEEPALEEAEGGEALEPVYVQVGDPLEGLFDGLLIGALLVLVLAGTVVSGLLQGSFPSYARMFSDSFLIFIGGVLLVVLLTTLVGWLIGRSASTRRA